MSFDLEKKLDEKFEEYRCFLRGEGIYRAMVILGEIYNCIPKLDRIKQIKWTKRIHNVRLNEHQLQSIIIKAKGEIREIERLLSIFNVWIVEEIVLILTLKIQVDLVIAVLNEMGYREADINLYAIDEKILQISKAEASKRPFAESVNLINKNWGMPLTNRWLDVNSIKKGH